MTLDINSLPAPIQPPKNPLDDFDPNDKPKHPYATYCPGRYSRGNGPFKLHSALAHALSALKNQGVGTLYEFEGGKWVEKARYNPVDFRPTRCEGCARDTMEHPTGWDYMARQQVTYFDRPKRNSIKLVFERQGGARGKLVKPLKVLALCPDCKRGMGY